MFHSRGFQVTNIKTAHISEDKSFLKIQNDAERRSAILSPVVGGGFGVDEEARDLGGVEFEGALERGDDGVDARHGQIVGQGAVAADLDAVARVVADVVARGRAGAGDEDLVNVENLGEG